MTYSNIKLQRVLQSFKPMVVNYLMTSEGWNKQKFYAILH